MPQKGEKISTDRIDGEFKSYICMGRGKGDSVIVREASEKDAFTNEAIEKGLETEMQSTSNENVAKDLVEEKLTKDPNFYDKKEKLEKFD